MAKKNPVQLALNVTLSPNSYDFLEKNAREGDISGTLAGWVGHWMDNQSRGGLMLAPEDHQYVADLNDGKRFKDSRALVRAVEKGMNREDGLHSFTVNVDPAHLQPLKEQAEISALTVEELINGGVNMLMTNGWLWDFSPANGRHIPFTAQMLSATAALCEKHSIDSSDVAGLIAEDRMVPVTRELRDAAKELTGKLNFTSGDLSVLLSELKTLRAENSELRGLPREMAAA